MTTTVTAAKIAVLASAGFPIVCVDTCSLLDLQRGLVRKDVHAHARSEALKLVSDVESGRVISVITGQIQGEFNKNRPDVVDSAAQELVSLVKQINKAEDIAAVFGIPPTRPSLVHLNSHAAQAEVIVDRWLAASYLIVEGPDLAARAGLRVNLARTPAKTGKQNYKDCLITETFLDLVNDLRQAGITSKVVFMSSNTDDYAESKLSDRLRADLAVEFNGLQMEYATNPGQARNVLGL